VACANVRDLSVSAAIADARDVLSALWLAQGEGVVVSYQMSEPPRNPFDLSARSPNSGPRTGFIATVRIDCKVFGHTKSPFIVVRFTTPMYRVFEKGEGWARPLRDGLVMELEAVKSDTVWNVRDRKPADAILEPDERARKPTESELPDLTVPWPEPLPGCARGTHWNGSACVRKSKRGR
jgi:hypothetical protein